MVLFVVSIFVLCFVKVDEEFCDFELLGLIYDLEFDEVEYYVSRD